MIHDPEFIGCSARDTVVVSVEKVLCVVEPCTREPLGDLFVLAPLDYL